MVDFEGNMVCTKKCPSTTDTDGIIMGYAMTDYAYDPDGYSLLDDPAYANSTSIYDADLLQCKDDVTGTRSARRV